LIESQSLIIAPDCDSNIYYTRKPSGSK